MQQPRASTGAELKNIARRGSWQLAAGGCYMVLAGSWSLAVPVPPGALLPLLAPGWWSLLAGRAHILSRCCLCLCPACSSSLDGFV